MTEAQTLSDLEPLLYRVVRAVRAALPKLAERCPLDDTLQTARLYVLLALRNFPGGNLEGWVARAAKRGALRELLGVRLWPNARVEGGARDAETVSEEEARHLESALPTPLEALEEKERAEQVRKALGQEKPRTREEELALERAREGLEGERLEAAEREGVNKSTLRGAEVRLLSRLKEKLFHLLPDGWRPEKKETRKGKHSRALPPAVVMEIRHARAGPNPPSYRSLAKRYGTHTDTVKSAALGLTYQELPMPQSGQSG